jgi:hypothetical protein
MSTCPIALTLQSAWYATYDYGEPTAETEPAHQKYVEHLDGCPICEREINKLKQASGIWPGDKK